MLTIDHLKVMTPDTVFASGIVENSPEGVYMTNDRLGDRLLWAAVRGEVHDWVIYIHWEESGADFVLSNGDKVTSAENIRKLVPCTDEAFKLYRK